MSGVFEGLNAMARVVWETACSRGWHPGPPPINDIPRHLMNVHTEVSELWEAYRRGTLDAPSEHEGLNLSQFEEELADIIIRALDLGQMYGIDLKRAVGMKDQFNRQRPYRHGGKLA